MNRTFVATLSSLLTLSTTACERNRPVPSHPAHQDAPLPGSQPQSSADDQDQTPPLPSDKAPSSTDDPWCPGGPYEPLALDPEFVLVAEVENHFDGFGNIEGPVWIDSALFYSNISGGKNPPTSHVFRFVPGKKPEVFIENAGSNGLATNADGELFAAMHSDGSVSKRSLDDPQAVEPLATGFDGRRFNSPNDLVISRAGTVFFTDPTWQAPQPFPQESTGVYRIQGGEVTRWNAFSAVENPNGITLSISEDELYVGGENGLFVQELSAGPDGPPARRVLTDHLSETSGIDGLGKDCAGNLYVTVHSQKLVVVLDSELRELSAFGIPSAGGVTNVAFGGVERKTLFVTSLGATPQIHRVELNVPGYPY